MKIRVLIPFLLSTALSIHAAKASLTLDEVFEIFPEIAHLKSSPYVLHLSNTDAFKEKDGFRYEARYVTYRNSQNPDTPLTLKELSDERKLGQISFTRQKVNPTIPEEENPLAIMQDNEFLEQGIIFTVCIGLWPIAK